MVHTEVDVLNKIRGSKDPDLALQVASAIILDYLVQRESSQSLSVAPKPEPYATV